MNQQLKTKNLFAALLLSIALFSAQTVFAQETDPEWYKDWDKYPGGAANVCSDDDIDNDDDGLIEICTLEMLDAVRHVLDGSGYKASASAMTSTTGCKTGGCIGYELVRDLDFEDDNSYSDPDANRSKWTSVNGWPSIGAEFNAIFEGNGHALLHLFFARPLGASAGLFSILASGKVINAIGLVNVDGSHPRKDELGGLVGENQGTISNSYGSGSVSGQHNVGGLVGKNKGTINNSYSSIDIRQNSGRDSGGLVGENRGTINNSYSTGKILSSPWSGGLVGENHRVINNSYSTGKVFSNSRNGGLVGGTTSFFFARANNSYWDKDTSGIARSQGGTSATTTELQSTTSTTGIYQNWSEDNWDFGTDKQYPAVRYATSPTASYRTCGTSQQPECGSLLAGQRTKSFAISTTATSVTVQAVEGETVTLNTMRTGTIEWKQTEGPSVFYLSTTDSAMLEFKVPFNVVVHGTMTEILVFRLTGDSATTVSIIVFDDNDDGPIDKPTLTRLSARTLAVSADLATDPDGTGTIEAYQWQICSGSSCSWQSAAGTSTASSYTIREEDAVVGNQFRVQLTYRDGQGYSRTVISEVLTIANQAPIIADIAPIVTTEGEIVTVVAQASDANFDNLNYLWRVTTGDKTPSLLADSIVTSATLVFTVPNDWADTTQTMLSLLVSVSDGETTGTNLAIVNITRIDNGELTTTPTITRSGNRLTVSADLSSDPDGGGTIEAYQWQICSGSSCSWQSAAETSTASSYTIREEDAVVGNQFRVQMTYRDGQGYSRVVISEVLTIANQAPIIADIAPIVTTEGEVVTVVAQASDANFDDLSYLWRATTGDKTPSLLADSIVTSATLVFTVPNDWADTTQTMLSLLVSVSDGETTGTNLAIVNITRIDNGELTTTPTITRSGNRLTVSADLSSDPDGGGTIEAYQWQICSGSSCSWQSAAGTSTASSYTIREEDAVVGNQFRVQLTYRDGQGYSRTVISEVLTIANQAPIIADIAPIVTTEGKIVTVVAQASDANFDNLNYLWRVTTGDKTTNLLAHSSVTSTTLVFTVPTDWVSASQTTLSLSISVSDGATTSTKPVFVNITRVDNRGLATTPTITETERELTVWADLTTDPDGDGTIQTYQWQLCRGSSATVVCDNEDNWKPAPGTPSTASSYTIQESDAVVGNQFRVQLTYRDGQNYQTTVTSAPLVYAALRIIDLDPIATTEGEVVRIAARVNVSVDGLNYVWRVTTGDKKPSILEGSTVTSAILIFTVPDDWANTPQATLNLFVSVGDGTTTGTNRVVVNIARVDNGGLATTPTITETERELTVLADLTTDPDGDSTIQTYQWQLCRGSSATVVCDNEDNWKPAPGTSSTASSYTIQEGDAVVGNQFRVQLTYRDGQGYSRPVISEALSYGQAKVIFIRLKLFLEGALQ